MDKSLKYLTENRWKAKAGTNKKECSREAMMMSQPSLHSFLPCHHLLEAYSGLNEGEESLGDEVKSL